VPEGSGRAQESAFERRGCVEGASGTSFDGDIGGRATVVRNCFDWLPSIVWNKKTKAKKNLTLAQKS